MKKIIILSFALLSIVFGYAKSKVTVRMVNETKQNIKVFIDQSDNVGSGSTNVLITPLTPGQDTQTTISVDKNLLLTGYGVFENGGKSDDAYKIIRGDDTFSVIVTSPGTEKSLTDLTNPGTILQYDPTKFLDTDTSPKPLDNLFNQYLGGIVAYVDDGQKMILKDVISPFDLGLMMKSNMATGTGTKSDEIEFSNQTTQNVNASVPVIAQLGIVFDASSLYSVNIEYRNIGVIGWNAQVGQPSLSDAFNSLPASKLYDIGYLRSINPHLKLKQINQAYVFDGIYLEVKQGTKLNFTNKINASTFFTNSGNYGMNNTTTNKIVFGSSYLGYWASSTAQDVTGSLDHALAVYNSIISSSFTVKTDAQVINDYSDLRSKNPLIPDLKTRQDIIDYYNSQVAAYKSLHPEKQNDPALNPVKITNSDNVSQLSDYQLQIKYEQLKQNKQSVPKNFDTNGARVMIKALSHD